MFTLIIPSDDILEDEFTIAVDKFSGVDLGEIAVCILRTILSFKILLLDQDVDAFLEHTEQKITTCKSHLYSVGDNVRIHNSP